MNFYSFLVSLCIAASIFSVSHALDKDPQNSVNSFERFRRLVKKEATLKMIQPYTQISEEDAVRRLIQNGGSMQDVVDLSLEYQEADEKVRRLVGPGLSLGSPHSRFSPNTYTHSRFNDIPTVLRVVKDGASYVVDLFVQMMKAGKSFGEVIRSFNNITNADTLDWYRNFASVDTSKLKTTACATYEINACMELMSPAVFETYRNTSQTLDANGDAVAGLYNAYFGSHACTNPTAPTDTSYEVTGCDQNGGAVAGTGDECDWDFADSDLKTAWETWTNAAKHEDTSMSIDWQETGETVKECDKVMKFTCIHEETSTAGAWIKKCDATIVASGSGHLTTDSREVGPDSTIDETEITVNNPGGTAGISTRNHFTQLVYDSGPKKGAVYRTCDAKVIEMYERIKFQMTGANYKSTSGCTSKVYEALSVDTDHVW